jgi:ribonuclease P protein component
MLKTTHRITKRQDFENVYRSGSFFSFKGVTMHVLRVKSTDVKIGFVVSKNFSKSAVKRNRAKRMLRSAIAGYIPLLPAGIHIVINYRPRSPYESSKELTFVIAFLLKKHRLPV